MTLTHAGVAVVCLLLCLVIISTWVWLSSRLGQNDIKTMFSWDTLQLSDAGWMERCGLDLLLHTRLASSMTISLLVIAGIMGLVMLIGSPPLLNISAGSSWMIIHVGVVYVVALVLIYSLYVCLPRYALYKSSTASSTSLSVLVRSVPLHLCTSSRLHEYFTQQFNSEYVNCQLIGRSAILSFKSMAAKTLALSAPLSLSPFELFVEDLPEHRNTLWDSLEYSYSQYVIRRVFSVLCNIALFMVLSSAVSLLSYFAIVKVYTLESISTIQSLFLFSVLAPLIYVACFCAMGPLLWSISHFEGHSSISALEQSAFGKLLLYVLIEFYVVTVLFGTLMDVFSSVSVDIFQSMTSTVQDFAGFFSLVVMYLSWVVLPLHILLSSFTNLACDLDAFLFCAWSYFILTVAVGITLSCFEPMVLAVVIPCLLSSIVLTRVFASSNRVVCSRTKSGVLFPFVFFSLAGVVFIFEVLVCGYMAILGFTYEAASLSPLIFITYQFMYSYSPGSPAWKNTDLTISSYMLKDRKVESLLQEG